ncbi:MAG: hypothetical protein FJ100_15985 [Deltaproteobacteria bacterium]|nr:hypothetical protein [Deltaproteobacteria bacterium]
MALVLRTLILWVVCLASCGTAAAPPATADSTPGASHASEVDATSELQGVDTAALPTRPDFAWDLGKPGPHGVGYRTFSHTYVPAPGDPTRTIGVHLWYPATATTGEHAIYGQLWPSKVAVIDAGAAPPAVDSGYPVLAYSHGYSGFAGSSPWLAEHFASHGWVVIAPDHTGNLLQDHDAPKPTGLWWWRARDVSAAVDAVQGQGDDAGLAGKARFDKMIVSGHSFGGYTVLTLIGAQFDLAKLSAACKAGKGLGGACTDHDLAQYKAGLGDKRMRAGMLLMSGEGDAQWFGPAGMAAIDAPVLLMTGSADGGHQGAPQWKTIKDIHAFSSSLWVDVLKGCHQLFGLGLCDGIPAEEGDRIARTYTLAFARRTLLGDSTQATMQVLSGKTTVSGLVTLMTGN